MLTELGFRTRDILLFLAKSKDPYSLENLREHFDLTERQVRYSIRKSLNWLEKENLILHMNGKGEYWFELSKNERTQLIKKLEEESGYKLSLNRNQRVQYEILRILTNESPITMKQFESELGVSHATISRDLKEVSTHLHLKGIKVVSTPNFGTYFDAAEQDFRRTLVENLIAAVPLEALLLTIHSRGFHNLPAAFSLQAKVAQDYITKLSISNSAEKVLGMIDTLRCTDIDIAKLFLYLAITRNRIRDRHLVILPENQLFMATSLWTFPFVQRWAIDLSNEQKMPVTVDEIAATAIILAAMKVADLSPQKTTIIPTDLEINNEVSIIANTIVEIASRRLHPFLRIDSLLLHGLKTHLVSVVDRLHFGLSIENSLAAEIRETYPEIYTVAKECLESLRNIMEIGIPDSELAFWTMHLGAAIERLRARPRRRVLIVCSEGIATAWLLLARIKTVFPYLDIVDVTSIYEIHSNGIESLSVDAIISTVSLSLRSHPVLVVSPMLDKHDILKISKELNIEASNPISNHLQNVNNEPCLIDLLYPQVIELKCIATDWEDAIRQAGFLLVKQRIVEKRYVKAMIAQIHRHGPYIVISPGIALAHALPKEGALRLGISLITLQKPVNFGHKTNDPVDIIFAFACINMHDHISALNELVDMLDDLDKVASLRNAFRPQQVLQLLAKHLP